MGINGIHPQGYKTIGTTVDKLIAAHQLALLANILAVQNQILAVLAADSGDSEENLNRSRRIMEAAASTIENTGAFLSRLGESAETSTASVDTAAQNN